MLVSEDPVHALVWSEATASGPAYPNHVNAAVAAHLNERSDVVASTASITEPEQGVPRDRLEWADVLFWWGHERHEDVSDATVDRVERAVRDRGLGFVALHSGHYARPFKRLTGASGDLGEVRRTEGETERVTVRAPDHPIAAGVDPFALHQVEMFGEPFDVPDPETVVFHSTFSNGGEFRSGVTFEFGAGRGFYFRPGHETYRVYHHPAVGKVLANASRWAARE